MGLDLAAFVPRLLYPPTKPPMWCAVLPIIPSILISFTDPATVISSVNVVSPLILMMEPEIVVEAAAVFTPVKLRNVATSFSVVRDAILKAAPNAL